MWHRTVEANTIFEANTANAKYRISNGEYLELRTLTQIVAIAKIPKTKRDLNADNVVKIDLLKNSDKVETQ